MKRLFGICLAFVMASACATTSAPSNKVVVTALPPLSVGIASYGGEEIAREDTQALQNYLSQKLGRDVSTKVYNSQGELAAAVAEGKVDLAWLPKSYIRDVTPDQTRELADVVNGWLADDQAPAIEYRRGVVRVHSDEDRGDEPPYPRSAAASGERVCGEPAIWMRDALRQRLQSMGPGDLTCSHNVCSYGGAEYAPSGYLFFHATTYMDEQIWVLDAWVEVYSAALSEDIVEKNDADVVRLMKRAASTSCSGEPAGMY